VILLTFSSIRSRLDPVMDINMVSDVMPGRRTLHTTSCSHGSMLHRYGGMYVNQNDYEKISMALGMIARKLAGCKTRQTCFGT
jgi:hypothetical protein